VCDVFRDAENGITKEVAKRIENEYGERGKKAVDTVMSGRVFKYNDFFVVEGTTGKYAVEGDFCMCTDYLARRSLKGGVCYHSLAVKLAIAAKKYTCIDSWFYETLDDRPRPADKNYHKVFKSKKE
jgi:predicted nucleic acid-binding Zn finger protein